MIRFSCPKCDTGLKTADEKAGGSLLCPDCGEKVDVPKSSGDKKAAAAPASRGAAPTKKAPAKFAGGSNKPLFIGIAAAACVVVAAAGIYFFAISGKDSKAD